MTDVPAPVAAAPVPFSVTVSGAVQLTGIGRHRILQGKREGEFEVRYPHGSTKYVILTDSLLAWVRSLPDEPPDP